METTILAKRLNEFLQVTTRNQAGFPTQVSTIVQLLRITTDIQVGLITE